MMKVAGFGYELQTHRRPKERSAPCQMRILLNFERSQTPKPSRDECGAVHSMEACREWSEEAMTKNDELVADGCCA